MDLVRFGDRRSEYFYFGRGHLSPRAKRIKLALDTKSIWHGEALGPEVCHFPVQTKYMA